MRVQRPFRKPKALKRHRRCHSTGPFWLKWSSGESKKEHESQRDLISIWIAWGRWLGPCTFAAWCWLALVVSNLPGLGPNSEIKLALSFPVATIKVFRISHCRYGFYFGKWRCCQLRPGRYEGVNLGTIRGEAQWPFSCFARGC